MSGEWREPREWLLGNEPRHPFEVSHHIVTYPFPLSDGTFASLRLPENLSRGDAERLSGFIEALARD